MINRENVINELMQLHGSKETMNIISNAIALLKEQEAKPPHYTHLEYLVNGKVVRVNHPECPRCFETGLDLWSAEIEKEQAYCKRCGQKVKWQ